jgi:hypothetical protein
MKFGKWKKNTTAGWMLLGLIYNPSYSGGRDKEYPGSKPDWANSS